jgi:hypothetical protein
VNLKSYLFVIALFVTVFQANAQVTNNNVLYQTEKYTLYKDSVADGWYKAYYISPDEIKSNNYLPDRELVFKFFIHQHNDEMPLFVNHEAQLYPVNGAVVLNIKFGQKLTHMDLQPGKSGFLEPDTKVVFRLDMTTVIDSINKRGYFTLCNSNRITKADLNHLYISGSRLPLSWDTKLCEQNPDLKLTDNNNDGIYEVELTIGNPADYQWRSWKLSRDISSYPKVSSGILISDALYKLSIEELYKLKTKDSLINSAVDWPGVWTRDNSYSDLLSIAMLKPLYVKKCLRARTKNGMIIQDSGTGGSWPVSTDRMIWASAAWEVYKVTGDKKWLEEAYQFIKKTIDIDLKTIVNSDGLIMGESSFLDRRIQTYPAWMTPVDIATSASLSTNAVFYNALNVLSDMAVILKQPNEKYKNQATKLKQRINKLLWLPETKYYSQYQYGRFYKSVSPRSEGLGEALAVLFNVADSARQISIIENTPLTAYGLNCIFPNTSGLLTRYQNDAIWPFVQGFWCIAAAKVKNEAALAHGIGSIYRAAAFFLTNKENMVAETGRDKGLEGNSDAQLWGVAANLAIQFRVFFGLQFDTNNLRFSPVIPEAYKATRILTNFKYRKAILDITVVGWGSKVTLFMLDGKLMAEAQIQGSIEGKHSVYIEMEGKTSGNNSIKVRDNEFSLATPVLLKNGNLLMWENVKNASGYIIYENTKPVATISDTVYQLENNNGLSEYQVQCTSKSISPSFLSNPVQVYPSAAEIRIETDLAIYDNKHAKADGFSGKGYSVLDISNNIELRLSATVSQEGNYLVSFSFSNGSGDFTTDYNCAIRSLYVNGKPVSVVVFPQMEAKNNWSYWSYTSPVKVQLQKGLNTIELKYNPWNENMSGTINTAYIDYVSLIKIN